MKSNREILEYVNALESAATETNKEFIEGWENALNYVFFNQEEEEEIIEYLKTHKFDKSDPLTIQNGWVMAYKWLVKEINTIK